jgi:hypothetical protein
MAKVDNNDVSIDRNILFCQTAFFPADHLAVPRYLLRAS